jgi:hypothetical protein
MKIKNKISKSKNTNQRLNIRELTERGSIIFYLYAVFFIFDFQSFIFDIA